MADELPRVMSWPLIIAILVATAAVTGLVLGALGVVMGTVFGTAGVGAATGAVGALLMNQRRTALDAHRRARARRRA